MAGWLLQESNLKIAIVAAEITPWAKVGGLADVIGALPAALKEAGANVSVILPAYKTVLSELEVTPVAERLSAYLGSERHDFSVLRAEGHGGVPLYLINNSDFFRRDGIYGDRNGDYPDNARRFIFFGRAAAIAAAELLEPDVVHAHDWHAAATPILLRADATIAGRLPRTLSVFTLHNLAFQGIFAIGDFPLLAIDWRYFNVDGLEFFGNLNLAKGAIELADGVSTVSPTYAREVTSTGLGFALEGVLRNKGSRFVGILNGADYNEWNPASDSVIAANFSPNNHQAKRVCTRDLRQRVGLPQWDNRPLVGMVTRLTMQKGADLLRDALDRVMQLDLQLVMLASGEREFEQFFHDAHARYPERLVLVPEFDNTLAHRIQAGADVFLMPSQFEPCGLTQMYALKYGTVPVVRATGGLRDTIEEFDPRRSTGNGFVFGEYHSDALVGALERMLATYADPPAWQRLMRNCFAADFSWDRAARSYLDWFDKLRVEQGVPVVGRDQVPAQLECGRPVNADPHVVGDEDRIARREAAGGDAPFGALHHRAQRVAAMLAVLLGQREPS